MINNVIDYLFQMCSILGNLYFLIDHILSTLCTYELIKMILDHLLVIYLSSVQIYPKDPETRLQWGRGVNQERNIRI